MAKTSLPETTVTSALEAFVELPPGAFGSIADGGDKEMSYG